MPELEATVTRRDALVSGWVLVGVAGVFGWAVYRLGGRGLDAIRGGLDPLQWAVLVGLTVGFVYTEGIQTFDRRWIPKLIQRARRLRGEAVFFQVLGPLYGLSLVGTEWKELAKGWVGTLLIVVAVLLIRELPAPWRGIVDFAVAAALAWGMVTILRRTPSVVWSPAARRS
ncbi:MAG: hypothetical protein R3253_02875 [Longimicrobiales bacterium]|nr:hypothetical protein [Longimicrobiales bacterium]